MRLVAIFGARSSFFPVLNPAYKAMIGSVATDLQRDIIFSSFFAIYECHLFVKT